MKYAIIESGGKQYKAVAGTTIEVDHLPADVGSQLELDQVLLVVDDNTVAVGTPAIAGAKVKTTVVDHFKGPKKVIFKYKPKIRYRRKTGHRQTFTRLQVDEIIG